MGWLAGWFGKSSARWLNWRAQAFHPNLVFYAPLISNLREIISNTQGSFDRDSTATYERNGTLLDSDTQSYDGAFPTGSYLTFGHSLNQPLVVGGVALFSLQLSAAERAAQRAQLF